MGLFKYIDGPPQKSVIEAQRLLPSDDDLSLLIGGSQSSDQLIYPKVCNLVIYKANY